MDSIEKFEETELPPKEAFYSKLRQENISDKEYEHAKKVWDVFKCETLKDYHMLYLKSDVLLLVDCWRNFKKVIYNQYQIDPSYCFTTAGLTWQCGLKYTKIKLETLQDIDMILMFENQIRGGYSGCLVNRYIKANNKYMKNYESRKT